MFNDYYLSVPERVMEKIGYEEFDESQLHSNVQSIYLNQCLPQEMSKIISKLSSKRSAGYDEISNQIIKACKSQLIVPLVHICNISMQTGVFPKALKKTIIQPHYKKKRRDKLENYRPIALIPCISKVIEKVIFQRISDFFIRKGILANEQFGYSIGRGTADANIQLVHQILEAKMKKKKVIAIFLDLSKAFDCVNHNILLKILYKYGIRGQAHRLIQSYLSERTQMVELSCVKNGKQQKVRSQEKSVQFSVPQGSVLGPFLFIVYVNCLKNCIEEAGGKAIMYVDDTNIIVEGDELDDIKTVTIKVLLAVQKLFASLNLSLNWDKTMYTIFNDNPDNFELIINKVQLTRVWSTSFLGVTISSDLKWNCQGEILISQLNKALFILSQMIQSLYKKNLVQIYFAFFHSMLSYCTVLWADERQNKELCEKIFRKQKKAVKLIHYGKLKRKTCRGLFKKYNIMTLTSLYIYQSIIFAKKYLSGKTNETVHQHNTRARHLIHYSRGHPKSPFHNTIPIYNHLPDSLKRIEMLSSFKRALKKWLIEQEFYNLDDFLT